MPMTLQELQEEQSKFEDKIAENDYVFIGPEDLDLMEDFMKTANNNAPIIAQTRQLHHFLDHKPSILKAIESLPKNTTLRLYIASKSPLPMLIHYTIEEYCEKHNIRPNKE